LLLLLSDTCSLLFSDDHSTSTLSLSSRAACRDDDDDDVVSGEKARNRDAAADEVTDRFGGATARLLCTARGAEKDDAGLVEKASDPPTSSNNSRLATGITATTILRYVALPDTLMLLLASCEYSV
jgi:hypothetical protein